MLINIKVEMSRNELYIAFLFLIFFCELAGRDSLVDKTRLVTGIKGEII